MRFHRACATLLVVCGTLAGCGKLDRQDVVEFVDASDDAARKRFAPEICRLRGEKFHLHMRLQGDGTYSQPTVLDLDRKLYCAEAAKFSRLRQYRLERKSLTIELAPDRRTARVDAVYVQVMPYYQPETMPVTPDDFREWQIVESRDESIVGIEDGDVVFLSTDVDAQRRIVPKPDLQLPFD